MVDNLLSVGCWGIGVISEFGLLCSFVQHHYSSMQKSLSRHSFSATPQLSINHVFVCTFYMKIGGDNIEKEWKRG